MIEKRYGKTIKIYADNCKPLSTETVTSDKRHKIVKSLYEDDLKQLLARYFSTTAENVQFSVMYAVDVKCWVTFYLTDDEYESYKRGELFH
jgi:hypothetical protein